MIVITEQGPYFFLGRSDKPKALPLQKWVAGDVLPSIRKTDNNDPTTTMNDEIEEQVWLMPVIRPETIGGESVNSVDARALHAALGVGKDFSTWVKNRIEQCRFKEILISLNLTVLSNRIQGGC